MTWVVKKPKRSDFCGCPPCPLCFDWQTEPPAGRVQDAWVAEIIAGMSKFKDDMLGGKAPTANENEVLDAAAEAIHVGNLSFGARVDAEFKAADSHQATERTMDAFLAEKRADAERPPPPKQPAPCLDNMDLSKINDPPPQPERVFVTWGKMEPVFDFVGMYETAVKDMYEKTSFNFTASEKLDDKQRREIQAKEDAKKRMKAQARGYAKVGR